MSPHTLLPFVGASLIAAAVSADPLIIRTGGAEGPLVEGMHNGWSMTLTDTSITGDEAVLFYGSPSFRILEIDPEADPPIQPDPEACFPTHARVLLGLGLFPEGSVTANVWDGDVWTPASEIPSPYTGQMGFGTMWGTSVSATPNGEYLLVGSSNMPGVHSKAMLGLDCSEDFELIPGPIIPRGHLDLYQYNGADWAHLATLGPHPLVDPASRAVVPPSGQPSALCACTGEFAKSTSQNGLGWSTAMLTFDNAGRENVLLLSGLPWFDGNGAYPVFAAVDNGDGTSTVAEVDPHMGTCCMGDGTTLPDMTALDCALIGGVLVSADIADCAAANGCCIDDECVADTPVFHCRLIGGTPVTEGVCEDEPCPSDAAIELGFSDPTACARGGAYLTIYDPLTDTFSPVLDAIDADGAPILPNGYDVGIEGLIPDPLAATGDPFPHQIMGLVVDATEEDSTLWIAVGAPFFGGVSGVFSAGIEPECETYYSNDLEIGPLTGRVLMYSLDPATMTVQHRQTLIADDPEAFMGFGASLSLSGSRLAVGAPNWQSPTSSGGATYIFELNGNGLWAQADRLHAQDAGNGGRFGFSVALHEDKLAVGAPLQNTATDGAGTGAVHRFNYSPATDSWDETELLLGPILGDVSSPNPGEQHWGRAVAITDRFVAGGGPQLVNAVNGLFGLELTNTGGVGLTDSRPVPIDPPPPPLCNGDVDGNQSVDILDIIVMLRGMTDPDIYPQCDLNGDSLINVIDLVAVIDSWGEDC